MLRLANNVVELVLAPDCGGSIAAFRWRNIDVLRPRAGGDSALDHASFPLVPFSNRIADGRFRGEGQDIVLPSNHESDGRAEVIHGFGWQTGWAVADSGPAHARLAHRRCSGSWPWPYLAEQDFILSNSGFVQRLRLRNEGASPMPAGMGVHPYFPRHGAQLDLAVDGRWEVAANGIPTHWSALSASPDWFGVAAVDHGYTGRTGPIRIGWPTHRLTITPASDLPFTVVYVPAGADYFCVEPVSHMTDAHNRPEPAAVTGLRYLKPGEWWETAIEFSVKAAS